jgi:hypothetical protein
MPVASINAVRSPSAELQHHCIRAVGGSSAVTKVTGPGVAVTRAGAGDYLLTWSQDPGNFLGATASLQATTLADLAGHTIILGAYDATAKTMKVLVSGATEVAHDLAALEWFTVHADFSFSNLDI